jgi:hypothetical protein
VNAKIEKSLVEIPFDFEVRVKCPNPSRSVGDSGTVLDEDPDGRLAFMVTKSSGADRTLGVRDFAPAKSDLGQLVLRGTGCSGDVDHALADLPP